jgi:CBS domain-containing protein
MRIREIMSQPVVTCPNSATLNEAARLMWEFDCGVIPVLGDDGRIEGVVTDRDICMSAYTQGRPLSQIPVTVAMAKRVVAGQVNDSVESIERLMQENQVRRIPVLDGESRPVGIVSLNDLARLAGRARKHAVDHEVVATLAAVCQPHRSEPFAGRPAVMAVPPTRVQSAALEIHG